MHTCSLHGLHGRRLWLLWLHRQRRRSYGRLQRLRLSLKHLLQRRPLEPCSPRQHQKCAMCQAECCSYTLLVPSMLWNCFWPVLGLPVLCLHVSAFTIGAQVGWQELQRTCSKALQAGAILLAAGQGARGRPGERAAAREGNILGRGPQREALPLVGTQHARDPGEICLSRQVVLRC